MDPPLPGAGVAPGVGAAGAGVPGTGAAGAGFAGAGVIGALVAGAAPLQITCAIVASNASGAICDLNIFHPQVFTLLTLGHLQVIFTLLLPNIFPPVLAQVRTHLCLPRLFTEQLI